MRCLALGAVLVAMAAADADAAGDAAGSIGCALTPPTNARLGFAALPPEPSAGERRGLADARRALERGELAGAKTAFEALARRNPSDGEARFGLAAVRASQGELDAACAELAGVIERDPVAFAPRYESDERFTKLRASAAGARLRAHVTAVEALWRQAARLGLPSILSRGVRQEQGIWRPRQMRAGVYLHDVARFVPLDPGVNDAIAALFNPAAGTVTVVKTVVSACHTDFCPRIVGAEATSFSLNDWRAPPGRWRYRQKDPIATELHLLGDAQGTSIRVSDCCCWKSCQSPWETIGGRPPSGARADEPLVMEMMVDVRGALVSVLGGGGHVSRGVLVGAGPTDIPLAREHADSAAVHDVLVDRKDGARLVFSTVDRCACQAGREGAVLRYAISTVDPATAEASLVMSGAGSGAAMLDGAGAVYVQTGETVRRWPSIGAMGSAIRGAIRPAKRGAAPLEAGAPIMAGVLLVPPLGPRDNCCGL